jgi:hypothetical protein
MSLLPRAALRRDREQLMLIFKDEVLITWHKMLNNFQIITEAACKS